MIQARHKVEQGGITLRLCGRDWLLRRPSDLETLWDGIAAEQENGPDDERLPYWVELWPSSLALAVFLHENKERIKGELCLDLGCGLGFTAMIGAWLGGLVLGMDYEPAALSYASRNAAVNAAPKPGFAAMDWRRPALRAGCARFIWGGDILYEKRFAAPVLAFLEHALAPGGTVWMAEPGRNTYDNFKRAATNAGWRSRLARRELVEAMHERGRPVNVNLWELSPA